MTKKQGPPEVLALIRQWAYKRFGVYGLLVIAGATLAFSGWWNWPKIEKLPGVTKLVAWLIQEPIPTADPERFAVALAHFEGDDQSRRCEILVLEALKEFQGVQILRVDRTIKLPERSRPEESEGAGDAAAREYLEASRADVLIWGIVLGPDPKCPLKLRWTTQRETNFARYQATADYVPPDSFWADLTDLIRLVVLTKFAEFEYAKERESPQQLKPFIEKLRSLVSESAEEQRWSMENRGLISAILGNILSDFGNRTRDDEALQEAVAAYEQALQLWSADADSLRWAATQTNLGIAHASLAVRERGTGHLEKALSAYSEALKIQTQQQSPLDWAQTQINRGNALVQLGEGGGGTTCRSRVACFTEAANVFREVVAAPRDMTREDTALEWAAAQSALGSTLMRLAKYDKGTKSFEEARLAYAEALKVQTREHFPVDWATTQVNLGNDLMAKGEQMNDMTLICEGFGSRLTAWEVFSNTHPAYASDLARGIQENIVNLKLARMGPRWGRKGAIECLAKHQADVERFTGKGPR